MAVHTMMDSLPNEIVLSILSCLGTQTLLSLAAVSRRFYAAAARVLRNRLANAASLPGRRLILECYHPSVAISTPWLYCDFVGTDDLPASLPAAGPGSHLAALRDSYAHFKPVDQESRDLDAGRLRRHRNYFYHNQQQPQQQQQQQEQQQQPQQLPPQKPAPFHNVDLDESELFTQLCTVANVAESGPRQGHFLSHVNVGDGVIRVWREWLARAATSQVRSSSRCTSHHSAGTKADVLWSSLDRDVGLRFRVTRNDDDAPRRPLLVSADEDVPVSYRLEHEELLVRTNKLLLALEKLEEYKPSSGKALMILMA